jgi:hypothetical protein
MREPDSNRFDTHAAEVYYGFASDARPEREYDHDDDPDFGNRTERSKSSGPECAGQDGSQGRELQDRLDKEETRNE